MITLNDIIKAQRTIEPYLVSTPLIYSPVFSEFYNSRIYFKPENLQLTGSFKIRGALNKILSLTEHDRKKGVIAASSGNHALGVAYGAKVAGTKATIVMPENAQQIKVAGVKSLGAKIFQYGLTAVERYAFVDQLQAKHGYTLIHSSNDPRVIAGQGTVGLELLKEMPTLDTIIVPLGAGALLAGIACAAKESSSDVRIIGVEPAAIPRFSVSREKNTPTDVEWQYTIADGLMMTKTYPGIYEMVQTYVDEVISVSDQYIEQALYKVLFQAKLLVEPSAVIGIAALLSGKLELEPNGKHVFILTGGNIDPGWLSHFINNSGK